jgi:hypothetical protein
MDIIAKCESEEDSNGFGRSFEKMGESLMRAIDNQQLDIDDSDLRHQMLVRFRK